MLKLATEESDNPDLRDRGYIYWRLLSTSPKAAKLVILAEKPVISDDTNSLPASQLDALISQLSTLAAVYHKPPSAFVRRSAKVEFGGSDDDDSDDDSEEEDEGVGGKEGAAAGGGGESDPEDSDDDDDLLGGGEPVPSSGAGSESAPAVAADPAANAEDDDDDEADLFGAGPGPSGGSAPKLLEDADLPDVGASGGLQVRAAVVNVGGVPTLKMGVTNGLPAGTAVAHLDVRVNVNSFCLAPTVKRVTFPQPVSAGASGSVMIAMSVTDAARPKAGAAASSAVLPQLQIAVREPTSKTAVQGVVPLWLEGTFPAEAAYDRKQFGPAYKACSGEGQESVVVAKGLPNADVDAVKAAVESAGIAYVGRRSLPGDKVGVYFATHAYGAVSAGTGTGAS